MAPNEILIGNDCLNGLKREGRRKMWWNHLRQNHSTCPCCGPRWHIHSGPLQIQRNATYNPCIPHTFTRCGVCMLPQLLSATVALLALVSPWESVRVIMSLYCNGSTYTHFSRDRHQDRLKYMGVVWPMSAQCSCTVAMSYWKVDMLLNSCFFVFLFCSVCVCVCW